MAVKSKANRGGATAMTASETGRERTNRQSYSTNVAGTQRQRELAGHYRDVGRRLCVIPRAGSSVALAAETRLRKRSRTHMKLLVSERYESNQSGSKNKARELGLWSDVWNLACC